MGDGAECGGRVHDARRVTPILQAVRVDREPVFAPLYRRGLAERRVGVAVAGSSHAGLVLSTKVGRLHGGGGRAR